MEAVALLPVAQRRELFSETAARMNTTPAVVEKDFWVTWVLARLFSRPELGDQLRFKGGTSLSKVYGLIERFSEDIDLVLDWNVLNVESPLASRSKSQQRKVNATLLDEARAYIGGPFLTLVSEALGETCKCSVRPETPHVIDVSYPAAFSDTYLRPELRLEVGPLGAWLPHEERQIGCYAGEEFPNLFTVRTCTVKVIKAERTFWEKATILHQEAHRPDDKPQPRRYSRHYYDLAKMAASPIGKAALVDRGLLADVVQFKQRFYPSGWARYDLAERGTMVLVPSGRVLAAVEADYHAMADMFFGEVPTFGDLMAVLQGLQEDINC